MKALLSMLLLASLVGCASKKDEHDVEEKVYASQVKDSQGLGETLHTLIQGSKSLTDAQKAQLENIFAANKKKAEELTERSYSMRSVLIKELLSGKVNQKEIAILKKKIKKIESLKLKNTFETVDKVNGIVSGHEGHGHFLEKVMMENRGTR